MINCKNVGSVRIFIISILLVAFGVLSVQAVHAQRLPREETLYVAISRPGMGLGPKNLNIYIFHIDDMR